MVSILLIGDEILSATVRERNLHTMLTGFAGLGYEVGEVRIVRDVVEEIAVAMRELRERSKYLVTAGGIGPTHDDMTLEAAARAFAVETERSEAMLAFLKTRYGDPLPSRVEQMADLPRGTEVVGCEEGYWPVIRWENVFILPGLPRALEDKMRRVLAMLPPLGTFWQGEAYLHVDESVFAQWLTERQRDNAHVAIGSYPVVGNEYDYRARVTVRGTDREAVVSESKAIADHADRQGWLVRVGGVLAEEDRSGGHGTRRGHGARGPHGAHSKPGARGPWRCGGHG